MAKTPPPKKMTATKRPPTPGAGAKRPVAKGAKSRPAGLFTWLAIGLVVIVVVGLLLIKVLNSPSNAGANKTFQPTSATIASEVTSVPASVFNQVGVTSSVVTLLGAPTPLTGAPALTEKTSTGKTLPELLYIGAEYCPYCAAERWAAVVALSRFGTLSGLGNTSSYSGDVYPNTPTFTFVKAKFTSPYLAFTGVETNTNYIDPATKYYKTLQLMTPAQEQVLKTYDNSKHIPHSSSTNDNAIPFMDFGGKYLLQGATYNPQALQNISRDSIASALSDTSSPITDAIIASANVLSATICQMTGNQPSTVCSSSGVMAAKKAMGIK